jgi:uncharacterized protein with NRDE domain
MSGTSKLLKSFSKRNLSNEKISRGALVKKFLHGQYDDFDEEIVKTKDKYSGYNLVYGDLLNGLKFFSNANPGSTKIENLIENKVYSLSNDSLDNVKKVQKGSTIFEDIINE